VPVRMFLTTHAASAFLSRFNDQAALCAVGNFFALFASSPGSCFFWSLNSLD
jgi:hypothetical protein